MKYISIPIILLLISCSSLSVDDSFDEKYSNNLSTEDLNNLSIKTEVRSQNECEFVNFQLPNILNGRYFYKFIVHNDANGLNAPIHAAFDHGVHKGYFCIPRDIVRNSKIYIQYHNIKLGKKSGHTYVVNFEQVIKKP